MQAEVDRRIKAAGAENAYFPLFIPESYLKREAEHVEGFSPELAVVTHAGGKELEEPVVVRPTSETVIGEFMAKWIQSYRDLPLLLNQWANVVRWELRPRVFLRTSEFLWQEGHTAHATEADARAYAERILHDVYARLHGRTCSPCPCVVGRKTPRGALRRRHQHPDLRGDDGRRQGAADGHQPRAGPELRQGVRHPVPRRPRAPSSTCWTTSWGVSTRMVGGLIMGHGDDDGLRIPPRLAPVAGRGAGRARRRRRRSTAAAPWPTSCAPPACGSSSTTGSRPRSAAGPPTGSSRACPCASRSAPATWPRAWSPLVRPDRRHQGAGAARRHRRRRGRRRSTTPRPTLLAEATARRDGRTVDVATLDEAVEAAATGFARIPWARVGDEGEAELAKQGVTVRCLVAPDGVAARAERRARRRRRHRRPRRTDPPAATPVGPLAADVARQVVDGVRGYTPPRQSVRFERKAWARPTPFVSSDRARPCRPPDSGRPATAVPTEEVTEP